MVVQQARQGFPFSHVLKQTLECDAGGICEYTRLNQVKLPTPTPCWTGLPMAVLRALLPQPPAWGSALERRPHMGRKIINMMTLCHLIGTLRPFW